MQYLALCAIVKDEGPFLKEWILYHSMIGVEHFFLYDNGSNPPVSETLGDLAAMPHVTILGTPNKAMQLPVYNHCLMEFGSRFAWIAFIDVDEFICPAKTSDLRILLAEYEPYGGLALNWRVFSSNGHASRPQGLVIENYTHWVDEKRTQIKSIVRPEKTAGCRNAHAFGYLNGAFSVNESFEPLPPGAAFWLPSHEQVWINHYYYKSREDFALKLSRSRNSVHQENQPWWNMDLFDKHLLLPHHPDRTIVRFSPKLRTALGKNNPLLPFSPPKGLSLPDLYTLSAERLTAGQPTEALVCLCHAAALQESHDLWTMRATLARILKNLHANRHFLRQASRLGESLQFYVELAELAFTDTDPHTADDAIALLSEALNRTGITEGQWMEKLRALSHRNEGQNMPNNSIN